MLVRLLQVAAQVQPTTHQKQTKREVRGGTLSGSRCPYTHANTQSFIEFGKGKGKQKLFIFILPFVYSFTGALALLFYLFFRFPGLCKQMPPTVSALPVDSSVPDKTKAPTTTTARRRRASRTAASSNEPAPSSSPRQFSWKEVAQHNTLDDIWVIYEDAVYDVTGMLYCFLLSVHFIQLWVVAMRIMD